MSDDQLERDLREAFAARAGAVEPRARAYTELQRRSARPRRRPALYVAVTCAAAAAVWLGAVVVPGGAPDDPQPATSPTSSPSSPSFATPEPTALGPSQLLATVPVDGAITSGTRAGLGYVWATGKAAGHGVLVRIDPRTNQAVSTQVGSDGGGGVQEAPAVSSDQVWYHLGREVVGLDAQTLEVTTRVPVSGGIGVAAAGDAVWAVDGARLVRIDAATGEAVRRVALPATPEQLLVTEDGSVVATLPGARAVVRVSPDGAVGDAVEVGAAPGMLVEGDGLVWVALRAADELVGMDPQTLEVDRRFRVPGTDEGDPFPAYDPDRDVFWVAAGGGSLSRVDAADGRVTQRLQVGTSPYGGMPSYADGSVWFVTYAGGTVVRLDPDR